MTFIAINNSKTLAFIITVGILIFSIGFLSIFFKFYKINNSKLKKVFNNKNVMYLASLLGLIVGIIFSSFNHFNNIDIDNVQNSIWLWDCISFVYGFGMYLVAIGFLFSWLVIPVVAWRAVSKYIKQESNISLEIKKIGFILLLMFITTGVMNIEWVVPFNDLSTPLSVFKVTDTTFAKDGWFTGAKFLFDKCFLTIWYPWVFLSYAVLAFIICFIVALVIDKKYPNKDLTFPKKVANWLRFPYEINDVLGTVGTFSFISCYFMFNLESFFIHLSLVIVCFILIYLIVDSVLLVIIASVYRCRQGKRIFLKTLCKDSIKKEPIIINKDNEDVNWWYAKIQNSPAKAWNLCDASIVGLTLTIYLGFANNFAFDSYGHAYFTKDMYDINFWILVLLSGFVYNYLAYNQPANAGFARNFMGASTYSITPGLQTGIFGWIMPSISKISKFTDNLICAVV